MDITSLPRYLIYRDRFSISEFNIYENNNINQAISDAMLELPFIQNSPESERIALSVFNNAYYICTMVLLEKDPRWRLIRYKELVSGQVREIAPLTLSIIGIYLSSKTIVLNEYQEILKDNILKGIHNNQSWYSIYTFLLQKTKGIKKELLPKEFAPRFIDERLFIEINIDCQKWVQITDCFNKQRIIDLVDNIGQSKDEKLAFLKEIDKKAKIFYRDNSYYNQTVTPDLNEIENNINEEYNIEILEAIDDCRREEYENLGDMRPLNKRIQELKTENKNLQERVASLSGENSVLVNTMKEKEHIIKNQKETIDDFNVLAKDVTAQQKVRMEMAWQLFEKAGLTQDILNRHGKKAKAAIVMGALLDIKSQKCAQYLSDRDLSKHRHKQTITQLNTIIKELNLDIEL